MRPEPSSEQEILAFVETMCACKELCNDNMDIVTQMGFSAGFREFVRGKLQNFELARNKDLLLVLYMQFCGHDSTIFGFWQPIFEVLEASQVTVGFELVRELLRVVFDGSCASWFASTVLLLMVKRQRLGPQSLRLLTREVERISAKDKIAEMLCQNKDLTSSINAIRLMKSLSVWSRNTNNSIIEYIHTQNPNIRNVYQVERMKCHEIGVLNRSFKRDGVVLIQVINSLMVVWNGDTDNIKINLNNLVRAAQVSNSTVSLVFKKLGPYNTISYKLNNFMVEVEFRKEAARNSFLNKLRSAQKWRPKPVVCRVMPLSPAKEEATKISLSVFEALSATKDKTTDELGVVSKKKLKLNSEVVLKHNIRKLRKNVDVGDHEKSFWKMSDGSDPIEDSGSTLFVSSPKGEQAPPTKHNEVWSAPDRQEDYSGKHPQIHHDSPSIVQVPQSTQLAESYGQTQPEIETIYSSYSHV
ncbi:hypothetical protein PSN45_002711 [Yamadazyma tenuis]|uniref:uncharacterized protein n=1 Tax=Candida tenuis TaxID=2315449 RepID=UPI0027A3A73F|nr:hypothetical protein PSN45_002711 [Yamadazyma tenuis]